MTKPFDTFDGIEKVTSGYMGGQTENPTYEEVKSGTTGYYETVKLNTMWHSFHIINYWKYFFQ